MDKMAKHTHGNIVVLPVIADNFGRIHDTSLARLKILFPSINMGEVYGNFVYNSAMHIARC